MNVKTLTGSSISALLAEARQLFGDDVVLLESVPPNGNQHARITVMVDAPPSMAQRRVSPEPVMAPASAPEPAPAAKSPVRKKVVIQPEPVLAELREHGPVSDDAVTVGTGFGYQAAVPRKEDGAGTEEAFSRMPPPRGSAKKPRRSPSEGDARKSDKRRTGRGSLYPVPAAPSTSAPSDPEAWKPLGDLVTARMAHLERRLQTFENLFAHAFVGSTQPWMTHPLYGMLLKQGLRTRTLTRLFNRLSELGFEPTGDASRIQWALAKELHTLLDVPLPKSCTGSQLFIGAAGSGKTSLQLKLARNPRFLGRHKTTILVIEPEEGTSISYQSPVELYRRFDLSVQTVQRPEEMPAALERARKFSHILIDTPPLPLQPQAAHAALLRLQYMTESLAPLQVHLVIDASRVLESFDQKYLKRMGFRPDTLALTRLDETTGPGRIAECLMDLRLPVQFVSTGISVPDYVSSFSASRLVEGLLNMSFDPSKGSSASDLL